MHMSKMLSEVNTAVLSLLQYFWQHHSEPLSLSFFPKVEFLFFDAATLTPIFCSCLIVL